MRHSTLIREVSIVKRREITNTWLIRILRIHDNRVLSFKQDLCSSPSKAQRTLHNGQEESSRQKTGRSLSNVIWTQCSLGIGQSLPSFKQSLVEVSKCSLKNCHKLIWSLNITKSHDHRKRGFQGREGVDSRKVTGRL